MRPVVWFSRPAGLVGPVASDTQHHRFSTPVLPPLRSDCQVVRALSLRALEEASVCPLHGYESPEHYYAANKPDGAPPPSPTGTAPQ